VPHPARQSLPGVGEDVDLGNRTGDAGKLDPLPGEALCERGERVVRLRPRDEEVERRRLHVGADERSVVLDAPEAVLAIRVRLLFERRCETEDEVVPRFVGEQQRAGTGEERSCFVDVSNVQDEIVRRPLP
jgi:hypothetical protein